LTDRRIAGRIEHIKGGELYHSDFFASYEPAAKYPCPTADLVEKYITGVDIDYAADLSREINKLMPETVCAGNDDEYISHQINTISSGAAKFVAVESGEERVVSDRWR